MFSQTVKCTVLVLLVAFAAAGPAYCKTFERLQPEITPNYQPDISGTEAGLWMVFNKAEESLKTSPNRLKDPELDHYLKTVICKLSEKFCPEIRVYVMRMPYFNANMAPNGVMQVWTGLLLRVNNEAQLATVLGHEMGHYLRRHSLKSFEDLKHKSVLYTFLSLGIEGALAAGGINPDLGYAAMDMNRVLTYASLFAFSRNQEREADKYGIQLLNNTQLSLEQAPVIWGNLIAEEKSAQHEKKHRSIFFATHPAPKERLANLKEYVQELSEEDGSSGHDNLNAGKYWKYVGPHLPMLLEDEINLNQFGRTLYVLRNLLDNNIEPGIVRYYMGELYRRRNKKGDIQLAIQNYLQAIDNNNCPAEAHRSLGLLYYKNGDRASARKEFQKYLDHKPDASDHEMIQFYISSLSGDSK